MADDSDSSPSPGPQGTPKAKKRRLHGACDTCRKRKIKCDSAAMPGNLCTNCQMSNIKCTHDIPRQPKKKDSQQSYIRDLEDRLTKMETLLQVLHPGKDIDNLIGMPVDDLRDSTPSENMSQSSKGFSDPMHRVIPHLSSEFASDQFGTPIDEKKLHSDQAEEVQDLAHIALSEHLSQMSMAEDRFFGQSSSFMFAKHTMTAKNEATGAPDRPLDPDSCRRPLFWDLRPWEMAMATTAEKPFVYPPPDLLESLVSIYFEKANIFMPVLHRPTFMSSLQRGQHLWDTGFGMTVLSVCAVASRYSSDPRIFLEGDNTGLSCGWSYFSQIPVFRNYLFYRSTIYDLQYYTLAIVYLLGTSIPHASWALLGLGIRYSLEKGLHRRKGPVIKKTVEEELAKRAFWCLICIDRWMSSFLGRPCAVQDEDFDVDYPVDCDDEYWETEDPDKAFQQPPGKPSKIASFLANIKLAEIHAFALRMLYSTKKSKMLTGLIGKEWEYSIVAELDSSLNKWKDSLPLFLQWNPNIVDPTLFHQSVVMHSAYYYLQIQIHRPFLTKKSALSLPSLAICTNAARSCAHVVEAALTRGLRPFPIITMGAFASALVLLLNHWVNRRGVTNADTKKEQDLYNSCFLVLKESEKRWHVAGRFVDMLLAMGSLRENQHDAAPKRRRGSDPGLQSEAIAQTYTSPKLTYGNFKFAPDSPLTQASAGASPPSDLGNTASSIPANDWDFSNLLLAQMGYMHQQSQQYPDGSSSAATSESQHGLDPRLPSSLPYLTSSFAPPSSVNNMGTDFGASSNVNLSPPAQDPLGGTAKGSNIPDEFFSMWSSLPASLDAQDWETFMSTAIVPYPPENQ